MTEEKAIEWTSDLFWKNKYDARQSEIPIYPIQKYLVIR